MYDRKDLKRIEDIIEKGNGFNTEKSLRLARTQANRITNIIKAKHRAEAAEDINAHQIAAIFFDRYNELTGTSRAEVIEETPEVEELIELKDNAIYFPTSSAFALWTLEILGQLSDGAWENARPSEHWVFWAGLNVGLGPSNVTSHAFSQKNKYDIGGLKQYVGDRMLKFGRIGKAAGAEVVNFRGAVNCVITDFPEEGPFDLHEFKVRKIAIHDHMLNDSYWEGLTQDIVNKYYNTTYTDRDLNNDIRLIKNTMLKAKI